MTQPAITEPFKVTSWRLANGLRVAVLRDPRARLTSIDLRFDVGTGDDPIGRSGFALLAGEAVGLRSSSAELTSSVAIDLDRTELTATTLDVPAALELAARRLETTCADLTPGLLAAARDHALQQLTGVPPAFVQAVWGEGHPYAHELGTPQLAAVSQAELCAFHAAFYGANAATLVVTGPLETSVPGAIDARFHDLVAGSAKRAAIPTITPASRHLRDVVWGLARPTAALVFSVPVAGDLDGIVPELAVRRIQIWAQQDRRDLHAVLVGGRRGRALVLGLEVDREAELPAAHERLRDLLAEANFVIEDDRADTEADDQLRGAEDLDDPFVRGSRIADQVASGRRIELLRRAREFATATSPRSWIREHLTTGAARTLDLIPAVPDSGASIEDLGAPAVAVDSALAGVYRPPAAGTPSPADPYGPGSSSAAAGSASPPDAQAGAAAGPGGVEVAPDASAGAAAVTSSAAAVERGDPAAAAVPALARPIQSYALANGLRVVLSPDPQATTVDVRLVFPVGTAADPAPGIALRAAADLKVSDAVGPDDAARKRIVWYGDTAIARNEVDVTTTTTHFRAFGFANLADWHVFSIAWHVIDGTYELAPLRAFARHYAPKGATLIVTGGFDPAALAPVIERWYGPWKPPVQPPPRAVPAGPKHPLVFESGELQSVDLELAYGPAKVSPGAAMLLASTLQDRLARLTRTTAAIAVQLDPRDLRLLLTAQLDPVEAAATARAIAGELAQLRATSATVAEIDRARRRAVAHLLAAEIGVTGRGRALEAAIANGEPPNTDRALAELRTATADQVTEAARLLIDPAALQVSLRSPKAATAEVLRALGLDPATAERR